MLEFRTYCYLQNQKTGCTFVEQFLRKFSAEPLVKFDKHAAVAQRDPAKFYFINVREPLELYRSLYAYGLDGKGTVWERMTKLGLQHMYAKGPEGFSHWLRFVLDPKHALALGNGYTTASAQLMGLMTWRFYRLAVAGFEAAAPSFKTRKDVNDFTRSHYFMNNVLKQETLREDLVKLVQGPLANRVTDVDDAVAWIEATPRINASASLTEADNVPIDQEALQLIFSKERRLYRIFYPDAEGFAQWRATKED
ncbi:hypothetical protein [Caenimonas koreensis]|uniref:Sulfotransferase family protein n=1 Tax=Caenimonas koreensis DSM 17982 TaxID=1121255 RepID=A0A844B217_9BURK|nr:hypothetical protein [Caenimonas koreensis]MRD47233.1 hypothetical protein [Caenimonas koreensis DSM 17982]